MVNINGVMAGMNYNGKYMYPQVQHINKILTGSVQGNVRYEQVMANMNR